MAVVPVKPFAEAKQRLARVMEPGARVELASRLLEQTLGVLQRARGLARIAVISRDEQVLEMAARHRAWAMWETAPGLNRALEQATRVARANGLTAVLVVPADLPNLAVRDIQSIVEQGRRAPCLVLAPARRDGGTNALLVNPAGLIHYAFGEASFDEHCRRARVAGARVEIYRSESVEFDLDSPEDWEKLSPDLRSALTWTGRDR